MDHAKITPKELGIPEAIPLPKRKDWRIGMVAFGGIAKWAHAPAYRDVGWTIAAAADPDPAAREVAREKFGIKKVYTDFHDLIADDEVEIVDMLTQPVIREEIVAAAVKAGKPIATEKPLADTVEEATRMVEMTERAGIPFAVHQNYRWRKTAYLAHHIIQRGFIGTPFFASIEIFGRQDVDLAQHPFYSKCDDFLTIQWDTHLGDLMRFWTGRDQVRVFARTGRMPGQNFASDNLLMVVHDFGEGLAGHILHSELLRSHLGGVQCRVDGPKGSIVFDFDNVLTIQSTDLGKEPRLLDTAGLKFISSFAGSMGDFLMSIEEGCEPMVSARKNLATIRTVLAEARSTRAGGQWMSCT